MIYFLVAFLLWSGHALSQGITSGCCVAPIQITLTTALSAGSGAEFLAGDSVAANSNPFTYSYIVGGSSGALASLGFNSYYDAAGTLTRVNTSKGAWHFDIDQRTNPNGSLAINITTAGGVDSNAATIDTGANLTMVGYVRAPSLRVGTAGLTQETGTIGMLRVADPGTAPGATGVKLVAVCGTNTGTAKLIAYAGTSTTPVTVTDNIGSGVSGC